MKYDKRAIMKRAWELFKNTCTTFSCALTIAWREAKSKIEEFTNPWKKVEKAAESYVESLKAQTGLYVNWYCHPWEKGDIKRTYIDVKIFRGSGKVKREISCGYFDDRLNKYFAVNRFHKNVVDLLNL